MSQEPEFSVEAFESAGVRASLVEYLHACPICEHTELEHYCRVPSLFNEGEYIRYERCGDCGVVLRNPRLPSKYRLSRYEDKLMPGQKRLKPKGQVHYAYMMEVIRRLLPAGSGRRFLDFGCGNGGFLVEARKAGFEVMGLELNKDLAGYVEEVHDIPVFQGLIADPRFADARFEVIVTSQVFEHLVDPRQTLAELRVHLAPPGLLLIEVPNLLALRERLRRGAIMNDSHLFYFSGRSMSRMLRDGGFEVLEVQEGLRPYRMLTDPDHRPPLWLMETGMKALSMLQVKTGLSVFARLA